MGGHDVGKRTAAFDAYIARQQPFAKPVLKYLRDLVHEVCPETVEVIKWGHPHFDYKGPFAGLAAFKAHATFGFWKAGLLAKDGAPLGKSDEKAMGSFGRLRSVEDLPGRRTMVSLLKRAMKLNDDGVKHPARSGLRKPIVVRPPAFFMSAVRRNAKALATYESLAPSHRREYVEWVTGAKTDATRDRRLATTVTWLSQGKRHNWKYEKR
jgi:uncharacterized protein YdeI (YjbR/CyaY-like superfamily)